ncbi:MAG: class I SAM-dependent methyltransferase [Corynebacterium sp.]|nr:class I SAM-dependent methyltransferase [Corynebacterium sp.]
MTGSSSHLSDSGPINANSQMPMSAIAPDPSMFPVYREPSKRNAPVFASARHKTQTAQAFFTGAEDYDTVRPAYPDFVVTLAGAAPSQLEGTVIDIGAGTGKLTLALPHQRVLACDPSFDMVRILAQKGIPCWLGVGEELPLSDSSITTAFCAQAWHWLDANRTCQELDRVLTSDGKIVLVWNTLNVNDYPWVLRLSRIMHSGDVLRPDFVPEIHAPWEISCQRHEKWNQPIKVADLHTLMHSRSYWLNAKDHIRTRMTHNLRWYLNEHLSLCDEDTVQLPYRTDAFVLSRTNAF